MEALQTEADIVGAVCNISPGLTERERFLLLGRIQQILDRKQTTEGTKNVTKPSFNLARSGDGRAQANRPADPRILEGKLGAQVFRLALPVGKWNGCLLLCAHGYRSGGHGLVAELDEREQQYAELLAGGWIVGATSYRREGVLTLDAVEDLCELQAYVGERFGVGEIDGALVERAQEAGRRYYVARHGQTALSQLQGIDRTPYSFVPGLPALTVLEGCSMGGAIVTMAVERHPDRFMGAVGLGSAIMLPEGSKDWVGFTYSPQRPILQACNEGDAGYSALRNYCDRAMKKKWQELGLMNNNAFEGHLKHNGEIIPPALWTVDRPGHVFISEGERACAIRFLLDWLRWGTNVTRRSRSILEHPRLRKCGWSRVIAIDVHGNFTLDMQEADLHALGIRQGCHFSIMAPSDSGTVGCGSDNASAKNNRDKVVDAPVGAGGPEHTNGVQGRIIRVTLTDYYSVGLQDMAWKGVITPQGSLRISRKTYRFSNPAAEVGIVEGTFVFLSWEKSLEDIGKVNVPNKLEELFLKEREPRTT